MCFMAQEDEVQEFLKYDELLDAFNELFLEFKKEKKKKQVLEKGKWYSDWRKLFS